MRLIGYVRRSCKYQQGDNYSQQAQIDKLKGFCALYGYNLLDIVCEDESAKSVTGRPLLKGVLRRILHDEKGERLDGLLVVKLDRFSRDETDAHLIKKALSKKQKGIICTDEPINTLSEHGDIIFSLLVSLAACEHKTIVKRFKTGREAAQKSGRDMTAVPAFGKRRVGNGKESMIIDDSEEQRTLRAIYRLFEEGLSNNAVAERLNRDVDEFGKLNYPPKRAGQWHNVQIGRIRKRLEPAV